MTDTLGKSGLEKLYESYLKGTDGSVQIERNMYGEITDKQIIDPPKEGDTVKLIRNLSALSLSLTVVLLAVNFLTALRSETLGNAVHTVLVIVSSPMVCSGHWAMSLFLWACLLMVSLRKKP